jgi:3-hydroxyacyl-CoA dehydrogenase/enoyl-CoA hydratase/3-hydroxybutyryl-CoA epimerase
MSALDKDIAFLAGGGLRPDLPATSPITQMTVIGAGAMGRGIAQVSAQAGIEVRLSDVDLAAAERGIALITKSLARSVAAGRLDSTDADETLARIRAVEGGGPTDSDLIVEAVFEKVELKHRVLAEIESSNRPGALVGSNTSTLPILQLAQALERRSDFLGIHFFSPVDRMRLVELIPSQQTSLETLARAVDYVVQIAKVPIVVGDQRGFFASRVFSTYVNEGIQLLVDGAGAAAIEAAGQAAGFPAPPLAMSDAVAQDLSYSIAQETIAADLSAGRVPKITDSMRVIEDMVTKHGRHGRAAGAGFYDYPSSGPKVMWSRVDEIWPAREGAVPAGDIKDRLRFVMALEAVHCLADGVLRSAVEGNVGSVLGIGFPAHTGGVLRFIDSYDGGVPGFVGRCHELTERYGDRFAPPALLREMTKTGRTFG